MSNSNSPISQKTRDHVLHTIKHDMDPSMRVLHTKIGASVLLGTALSLAICGQFGIGLTSFARNFNLRIHADMDPVTCAILCGMLFSIFPVFVLKFMTSSMQFRIIFTKKLKQVAMWILPIGVVMSQYGHHGKDLPGVSTWLISAMISFYLFAKIKDASQVYMGQLLNPSSSS